MSIKRVTLSQLVDEISTILEISKEEVFDLIDMSVLNYKICSSKYVKREGSDLNNRLVSLYMVTKNIPPEFDSSQKFRCIIEKHYKRTGCPWPHSLRDLITDQVRHELKTFALALHAAIEMVK